MTTNKGIGGPELPPVLHNEVTVNFSPDLHLVLFHGAKILPIQLSLEAAETLAARITAACNAKRAQAFQRAVNN